MLILKYVILFCGRPRLSVPTQKSDGTSATYEKFGEPTCRESLFDGAKLIAQLLLKAKKQDLDGMNYSAASCGVIKKIDENLSQGRHPEMFLLGVQSRTFPDSR